MLTSRSRTGRASALATLLSPPVYRAVLIGLAAFCVFVGATAWFLRGGHVERARYLIPPGQTSHMRVAGADQAVGGVPAAQGKPPAVSSHANLLDHMYHITAEFGHYPEGGAHYGLDLDAWTGTPVHAPVGGTVTEVLRGCTVGVLSCGQGWGNHVWYRSGETGHYILLAHFSQLADWVQVGAAVTAGTSFGLSGTTGFSSGPHVHVQVNPGAMGDGGSTNPAWEFPWLHCTDPVLGALFGAACP